MRKTPSELDAVLDRVPVAQLEAAVSRRKAKRKRLTKEQSLEFDNVLRLASERHRIKWQRILSSDRDRHAVEARWTVYELLYCGGWCAADIHRATGHDRTRIHHGLRKRGYETTEP